MLGLVLAGADVVDRLLDGGDFLGLFVGNFRLEFFLQGHDQLHGVQRVSAEVVDE